MTKTARRNKSATDDVKKESSGSNCGICGKYFQYEHKMRVHLRIHTGETPFSCSYCEKSFAQKAALTVHERTHTGEKPFVCELCNKAFARADHLNQHNRTHTGEKPYACSVCGKSFATWSAISRHKMEHSSRESYPCTQCAKTFSRTDNLRSHILKTHLGKQPEGAKKLPVGATPTAKKKKAQSKGKEVLKESEIVSIPHSEDIDEIAKILQEEEENTGAEASQDACGTDIPPTQDQVRVKDEPLEEEENDKTSNTAISWEDTTVQPPTQDQVRVKAQPLEEEKNAQTSNAPNSHESIIQEKVMVKTEPHLEDDEQDNTDHMLGSHFLFGC